MKLNETLKSEYKTKAKNTLKSKKEANDVLNRFKTKSASIIKTPKFKVEDVKMIFQLLKDSINGSYQIPNNKLVAAIGGIIYIINPFDLFPDNLGGFVDDVFVYGILLNQLSDELKVYKKTLKIQSKRECKSKVKKESS
jgi:uncharacterized membrane protein YkvA (DUF1232 family)